MAPSFIFRNCGSSSIGRPNSVRNTCDGNGVENCRHEVDLSLVDEAVDQVVHQPGRRVLEQPSSAAERTAGRGACGTSDGPADRSAAGSAAASSSGRGPYMLDENTSGSRSTSSTPDRGAHDHPDAVEAEDRRGLAGASSRSAAGSSPPPGSSAPPTRLRNSPSVRPSRQCGPNVWSPQGDRECVGVRSGSRLASLRSGRSPEARVIRPQRG